MWEHVNVLVREYDNLLMQEHLPEHIILSNLS